MVLNLREGIEEKAWPFQGNKNICILVGIWFSQMYVDDKPIKPIKLYTKEFCIYLIEILTYNQ